MVAATAINILDEHFNYSQISTVAMESLLANPGVAGNFAPDKWYKSDNAIREVKTRVYRLYGQMAGFNDYKQVDKRQKDYTRCGYALPGFQRVTEYQVIRGYNIYLADVHRDALCHINYQALEQCLECLLESDSERDTLYDMFRRVGYGTAESWALDILNYKRKAHPEWPATVTELYDAAKRKVGLEKWQTTESFIFIKRAEEPMADLPAKKTDTPTEKTGVANDTMELSKYHEEKRVACGRKALVGSTETHNNLSAILGDSVAKWFADGGKLADGKALIDTRYDPLIAEYEKQQEALALAKAELDAILARDPQPPDDDDDPTLPGLVPGATNPNVADTMPEPGEPKFPVATLSEVGRYFGKVNEYLTDHGLPDAPENVKWRDHYRKQAQGGKSATELPASKEQECLANLKALLNDECPIAESWLAWAKAHNATNEEMKAAAGVETLRDYTGRLQDVTKRLYEIRSQSQDVSLSDTDPIAPSEKATPMNDDAVSGEIVSETPKAPEIKPSELPVIDAQTTSPNTQSTAVALIEKKNGVALGGQAIFPNKDDMAIMWRMAESAIKSGLLPYTIKSAEAAFYIIETGRELGIPATLALRKIQIIQGQPTLASELMWALVNDSNLLEDYNIDEHDDHCTVMVKRKGKQQYTTTFSLEMASKMMTTEKDANGNKRSIPLSESVNYRSQPRTMCKWRAIAMACRTIFPDVTLGLYAKEEMDEAA